MTLQEYENLTGTVVPASQTVWYEAKIRRVQSMVETMLGYTLDSAMAQQSAWTELGKSPTECACPDVPTDELLPADSVVYGYRLFPYNYKDSILALDPAHSIASVKLIKDGVTYKTIDPDDYMVKYDNSGLAKYLDLRVSCDVCQCSSCCSYLQLAVDGLWLGAEDPQVLPSDLLDVWADMVTYYADNKHDIKSQTLGTHSYTRSELKAPETLSQNIAVLQKYAGPNGTIARIATI